MICKTASSIALCKAIVTESFSTSPPSNSISSVPASINLNTSGGLGARYLGLGLSKQYRTDSVTLSLRMVSVATGEVLIDVLVNKQIFSYGRSQDVFRFIEAGTELIELEGGDVENDSVTIALQRAIEEAVLQIIKIGYDRGYWEQKYEKIN